MTRGRRAWVIAGAIVLVAAAGAAAVLVALGQPLYHPGDVRNGRRLGAPLDAPAQAEGEYWRVEAGVRLFHFADGAGRPVLVLHGGPGIPSEAPWAGLRRVEGFAFHYFHQRGCGRSTRPFEAFQGGGFLSSARTLEGTLGLGAQIADVERVRRLLGQDRLVLVGHSFGALVAALYAAEFPEHVAALVLEAPADLLVVPTPGGGIFAEVERRLSPPRRAELRAYLARYLDFGRLFERTEAELAALHREFGPYYAEALRANGAGVPENAPERVGGFMPQALYLSLGRSHDWRSALAAVRAPVLVLHGERDLQPLAATQAFAAAFPRAELRVVEAAGHFVHEDRPDAFAREVGAFLAGLRR